MSVLVELSVTDQRVVSLEWREEKVTEEATPTSRAAKKRQLAAWLVKAEANYLATVEADLSLCSGTNKPRLVRAANRKRHLAEVLLLERAERGEFVQGASLNSMKGLSTKVICRLPSDMCDV